MLDVQRVVIETMNILQFQYDIEGMEQLGIVAVEDITEQIKATHPELEEEQ